MKNTCRSACRAPRRARGWRRPRASASTSGLGCFVPMKNSLTSRAGAAPARPPPDQRHRVLPVEQRAAPEQHACPCRDAGSDALHHRRQRRRGAIEGVVGQPEGHHVDQAAQGRVGGVGARVDRPRLCSVPIQKSRWRSLAQMKKSPWSICAFRTPRKLAASASSALSPARGAAARLLEVLDRERAVEVDDDRHHQPGEEGVRGQREALDEDHVGVLGEPAQARRVRRIEAARVTRSSRTPGWPGIASVTRASSTAPAPSPGRAPRAPTCWCEGFVADDQQSRPRREHALEIERLEQRLLDRAIRGEARVPRRGARRMAARRARRRAAPPGSAAAPARYRRACRCRADGRERLGRQAEDQALAGRRGRGGRLLEGS